MKAIVFADRSGHELDSVCRNTCPALLHVGGKPVVEHTLEDLVQSGIHDITLVVCPQAAQIREALGEGARWGARLSYETARPGEAATEVLRRLGEPAGAPVLCLRGDVVRSAVVGRFLEAANEKDWEGSLVARAARRNLWLVLADAVSTDLAVLDPAATGAAQIAGESINIAAAQVESLADESQFFRACLKASAGMIRGLSLPGFEVQPRQRLGRFSRAPKPGDTARCLHVGDRARVAETVQTRGTVVIGDDCFVDEHTVLSDCVILPGTYLGSGLEVSNALVGPGFLVRFDLGVTIPINDPLWSAPMRPDLDQLSTGLGARLAGLLLLLASLPLWPLAALLSLGNGALIERVLRVGNKRSPAGIGEAFNAWRFRTRVPLLRNLPLLLSVIAGHLRLFGARPGAETAEAGNDASWSAVRAELPAGLLGPAQLHLASDAPEEELYLNEVVFAEARGLGHRLACLRDAIVLACSRRAWFAAAQS